MTKREQDIKLLKASIEAIKNGGTLMHLKYKTQAGTKIDYIGFRKKDKYAEPEL